MIDRAIVELYVKKESEISIYLINTMGEKVQQVVTNEAINQGKSKFEINKNKLSKGVYFVTVELNGTRKINKLVIH